MTVLTKIGTLAVLVWNGRSRTNIARRRTDMRAHRIELWITAKYAAANRANPPAGPPGRTRPPVTSSHDRVVAALGLLREPRRRHLSAMLARQGGRDRYAPTLS